MSLSEFVLGERDQHLATDNLQHGAVAIMAYIAQGRSRAVRRQLVPSPLIYIYMYNYIQYIVGYKFHWGFVVYM